MVASVEDDSAQNKMEKEQQQAGAAKAHLPPRPQKILRPKPIKMRHKSSKNQSEIWNHFTRRDDQNPEDTRAHCNYCEKSYASHSKSHGTTTLWNHFRLCPKSPYRVEDKKQKILSFETNNNDGSLKAVTFSVQECRKALAKMIIIDELPFKKVEGEGFKMFVRALQPKFSILSRVTVAKDCWDIYIEEKGKLK
jgi:BED zinc finger